MVNMEKLPPSLPACITVCQDGGLTCIMAVPEFIPKNALAHVQASFDKVSVVSMQYSLPKAKQRQNGLTDKYPSSEIQTSIDMIKCCSRNGITRRSPYRCHIFCFWHCFASLKEH